MPSVGVGVLLLFDPVVGEALLLGFFELRGDALDAKVVGVGMCLIWQGWRSKFCTINFACCPCRAVAGAVGVFFLHDAVPRLVSKGSWRKKWRRSESRINVRAPHFRALSAPRLIAT